MEIKFQIGHGIRGQSPPGWPRLRLSDVRKYVLRDWRAVFIGIIAHTITYSTASAQLVENVTGNLLNTTSPESSAGLSFFNDPSFLVVPIPVVNPSIGSGGALGAAMLFKADENSASSVIGGGGFYTSNGSWGAAAGASIAFDQDRYHVKAGAAYTSVSFDFYGVGGGSSGSRPHVTLTDAGYALVAVVQGRVAPHFYLGGQFHYLDIKTSFDNLALAGTLPGLGAALSATKNNVWSFGAVATYDTRNNDYAPNAGQLVDGEIDYNAHNFFKTNDYWRFTIDYNRYDKLTDNLVVASRGSVCQVHGEAPIFDLCLFGMKSDIRGYPVGQVQNKADFALQTELRWHAFWRVGFVAFGGIGSVGRDFGDFSDLLAAGGIGVRVLASREYGINVGIDGAVNKDGDKTIYFRVGEAF